MIYGIPGHFNFILASKSPRRLQLMREAGFIFQVVVKDFDESFPLELKGAAIAEYLAAAKAAAFNRSEIDRNTVIITADTIVWCNGSLLDKPADFDDAVRILKMLSGNTHEVITGVSFRSVSGDHTFSESTLVTFEHLYDDDIKYYINEYKPFDKAGAYGIQEWIGITGNSRIEGSYFNVMGLPVHRLISELRSYLNK